MTVIFSSLLALLRGEAGEKQAQRRCLKERMFRFNTHPDTKLVPPPS